MHDVPQIIGRYDDEKKPSTAANKGVNCSRTHFTVDRDTTKQRKAIWLTESL
jgi:hypothetical protein